MSGVSEPNNNTVQQTNVRPYVESQQIIGYNAKQTS